MKVVDAGCGWVPYLMERIDRRTEDRAGRHLATEQVRKSPISFHAELEERDVLALYRLKHPTAVAAT